MTGESLPPIITERVEDAQHPPVPLLSVVKSPKSVASPTRGCFAGGLITPSPGANTTNIAYVTISSQGGVSNFGDLQVAASRNVGLSDSTRGISAGSADPTNNIIEYVTIATLGNAADFGDTTGSRDSIGDAGGASPIRGVFAGGRAHPGSSKTDVIDYVNIMSVGNALDFGDTDRTTGSSNASKEARSMCGISNGHGGLG